MSGPEYPTDIVTYNGWERIHQGHTLNRAELEADLRSAHSLSEGAPITVEEVHFSYQPRVMWCGRHGEACDREGEWHPHWHEVRPTDDPALHFTLVREAKP